MKRFFFFMLAMIFGFSITSCIRQGREKEVTSSAPPVAESELSSLARPTPLSEEVQQKVLTFSLAGYTTGGKKKWEVEGDSASMLASDVVKLDNIKVRTWTEDNCLTLTSDTGTFDKPSSNAHFEQNVVVKSEDGVSLETDHLDWEAETEIIKTDAYVQVEKDNLACTGRGAVGEPGLKQVRMNEEVTVEIKGEEDRTAPPTVITCDGPMEVDYENNIAHFFKNVVVTDSRGKLSADKMDVFIDRATKSIIKVVCVGNVQISQEKSRAMSSEAVYLADESKVILTGSPRLIIYPEELEGMGSQ